MNKLIMERFEDALKYVYGNSYKKVILRGALKTGTALLSEEETLNLFTVCTTSPKLFFKNLEELWLENAMHQDTTDNYNANCAILLKEACKITIVQINEWFN